MSLYDSWSIEEAKSIGKKFKARCLRNDSYENRLTIGQEYEIEIVEPILPMSPLCIGTGNNGGGFTCHLTRFEKIEEVPCPI